VVLEPLSPSAGAFRLRVTGSLGPDYILQGSGSPANWLNLQTNTPGSMPFDFVDPNLFSLTNRFYRVLLGP
jgi:hypothetical protein